MSEFFTLFIKTSRRPNFKLPVVTYKNHLRVTIKVILQDSASFLAQVIVKQSGDFTSKWGDFKVEATEANGGDFTTFYFNDILIM
jgi:hypothetical protein